MNKVLIAVVVLIVLAGGGYFLLNSGNTPTDLTPLNTGTPTSGESMEESTELLEDDAMVEEDVVEIVVEGSEFEFSTAEITVKEGQTVRVVFKNAGAMPHDFMIDELGVATARLDPGEEETVEFVASETGTYEYYCSVGEHRAQGMVGTLTVE